MPVLTFPFLRSRGLILPQKSHLPGWTWALHFTSSDLKARYISGGQGLSLIASAETEAQNKALCPKSTINH